MKKFLLLMAGIAVVAGGIFFFTNSSHIPAIEKESAYIVPKLTNEYANETYHFSLMMPDEFTASEVAGEAGDGDTILLQDKAGNGIQIVVTPYEEASHTLTQEEISAAIPDMQITDAQPVEIGEGDTGLAFKSDNESFGGASREVWFVFRGNLYQISTYERLDDLLKQIFATWQFH